MCNLHDLCRQPKSTLNAVFISIEKESHVQITVCGKSPTKKYTTVNAFLYQLKKESPTKNIHLIAVFISILKKERQVH
jgi:hypothetical protein